MVKETGEALSVFAVVSKEQEVQLTQSPVFVGVNC